MRVLRTCVTAAVFAGVTGVGHMNPARGDPFAPVPYTMFFAGGDLWHRGAFAHGGALWSPKGLFEEGFTLKILGGGGAYRYVSAAVEVRGVNTLGAVMPGWRFKAGGFEATLVAGLDIQHHRLSVFDPGNNLRGTHLGVRAGADIWYEPLPKTAMLAANVSVSTVGPTYWTRVAAGWNIYDRLWIGPEAQGLGGPTYHQARAGIHMTAFRSGLFEWSGALGFATDSDRRSGFYTRIGVLARH